MNQKNKLSKDWWLAQRWDKLKLDPNQQMPDKWSEGSGLKLRFLCECGRISFTSFGSAIKSTSCGKCTFKSKEYWLSQKWGKVKIDPTQLLPNEWGPSSGRKIIYLCDCGKTIKANMCRTLQSCGKCSFLPKEHWLSLKYGELSLISDQELPDEWGPNSNYRFEYLCSCGKTTKTMFENVSTGHSVSCGKCPAKPLSWWLEQKWGKLRMDSSQELLGQAAPKTNIKLWFLCDCGNKTHALISNVTTGRTKSCDKCNYKPKEYWLAQRWDKLIIDPNQILPDEWGLQSEIKVRCICDCGTIRNFIFYYINNGTTNSCGQCSWMSKEHWLKQKWGKLVIDINQKLLDNWGSSVDYLLKFNCDCGGNIILPFGRVNRGSTKSCGCLRIGQNEFSAENEIRKFVMSLASDTFSTSYKIPNSRKTYDVYVPSKKLAIEFHGLIWHGEKFSTKGSKKNDFDKYILSRQRGDRLIQIYADEWKNKQSIIKNMIENILSPLKGRRISPKYTVENITSMVTRDFLDRSHYLGAASGCLTVIAKHHDQIVGVWVFMKREEGTVLWHRACWDHRYKTWNPHEKALNISIPLLKAMGFTRIITFSDNRFHTGNLYEKLGFVFEKNLDPEYSYTNGNSRVSKYTMRVEAGRNEKLEAEAKGWYRIWDSGKKRYSLSLE